MIFYNLTYYAANPLDIIKIWDGGMAFHGGFLGVCVSILVYCCYPILYGPAQI